MKNYVTLILFLSFLSQYVWAQTPKEEVSVASLKGVFCIPTGVKKGMAGIKIKIPAYTPDIIKIDINWDDGKTGSYDVNYPKIAQDTADVREHEYDLSNCMYDQEFLIRVTITYAPATQKAAWRVPTSVFFTNPPFASIIARPDPACVGQPVTIDLNLCPDKNAVSKIDFGDNTPIDNKSNHKYTHPYASIGTYDINVWSSNSCSTEPTQNTHKLQIIDKALPAIADSGATQQIHKDTVLVCLSDGKAIIRLDASQSTSASLYYWSGTGFTYLNKTNANIQKPLIQFNGPGTYTISLEVDNTCAQRSKKVQRVYKVLDLPLLTLEQPQNYCKPVTFTVKNPVPGATYTLNNEPLLSTGKYLDYSDKPYVLEAKLKNDCVALPVSIQQSFKVQKAETIKILFPKDTSICVGTQAIKLANNLASNNWTSNGASFDGTFQTQNTGTYLIRTQNGADECLTKDSVNIKVVGTSVQLSNQTVCGKNASFVKLNPSVPNGSFTILNCTACQIKSDTLFLGGTTQSQVSVAYAVKGNLGCEGNTTASISLSQPQINRFELNDGCEGTTLSSKVEISGTTMLRWYQNNNNTPIAEGLNPILKLNAGTHSIRIEAGSDNCSDTQTKAVKIGKAPQAFQLSGTVLSASNCTPMLVRLGIDTPQETEVQYKWYKNELLIAETYTIPDQTINNEQPSNQTVVFRLTQQTSCGLKSDSTAFEVQARVKALLGVDSTSYRCNPATMVLTNYSMPNIGKKHLIYDNKTIPFEGERLTLPLQAKGDSLTTYLLSLVVESGCNSDTSTVEVKVYPARIRMAYHMSSSQICRQEKLLVKDITPSGWAGTIEWKFSDGERFSGREIEKTFNKAGTYSVRQIMKLGCVTDSLERQIIVTEPPAIKASLRTPAICMGQKIEAIYEGANRFVWAFGSQKDSSRFHFSQTITSKESTGLSLTVFGDTPTCKADTSFNIQIRTTPVLKDISAPEFVCSNGIVTLKAEMLQEATEFIWTLTNGTQQQTLGGSNPSITLASGVYDLKLRFSNGSCADSIERLNLITVDTCAIGIPEVFTPNGDIIGEKFTIFGSKGVVRINFLKIFDSWGKSIFFAEDLIPNNFDRAWDGTNGNQQPVPPGNYPFQTSVQLAGREEPVLKTGVIRVVR